VTYAYPSFAAAVAGAQHPDCIIGAMRQTPATVDAQRSADPFFQLSTRHLSEWRCMTLSPLHDARDERGDRLLLPIQTSSRFEPGALSETHQDIRPTREQIALLRSLFLQLAAGPRGGVAHDHGRSRSSSRARRIQAGRRSRHRAASLPCLLSAREMLRAPARGADEAMRPQSISCHRIGFRRGSRGFETCRKQRQPQRLATTGSRRARHPIQS
jgi:hypothetical protein